MAEQLIKKRRFVSLGIPIDKFIEDQKTQEHSFKDTQRCKFAEFLNSKTESRRIEEIPPKELNEYISEFIVAARRKDGEDFDPSSLRGLICSFSRHLKACSVIQTHHASACLNRQTKTALRSDKLNFIGLPILDLPHWLFPYLIKN